MRVSGTVGVGWAVALMLGSSVELRAAPLGEAVPADGRPTPVRPAAQAAPGDAPTVARPLRPGTPEGVRPADGVKPLAPSRQVAGMAPPAEVVRPNRAPPTGEQAAPAAPGAPPPPPPMTVNGRVAMPLRTGGPAKPLVISRPAAAPATAAGSPKDGSTTRPPVGKAAIHGDAEQAPGTGPAPRPSAPPPAAPAAKLKLAPSANELEAERQPQNQDSPTPVTLPNGKPDPREGTPRQYPKSPTRVDHTRGPGNPVGPGTAEDRKGMLEDVSGPSQGVIRNRW